jgi:hypothetical protein
LVAARQAYAGITFGAAQLQDGKLRKIPIALPAGYDEAVLPVVRERLAQAGCHLAQLLNAIAWPAQP